MEPLPPPARRYATPDMTDREVLDVIADALAAQGGPSMDGMTCLYRGPGGRRCAAGVLIRDAAYDPSLEGHTLKTHDPVWHALIASGVPRRDRTRLMIEAAQDAHDCLGHQGRPWSTAREYLEDRVGSWIDDAGAYRATRAP